MLNFPAVLRAVEKVISAPRTGKRSRYKFVVDDAALRNVLAFLRKHAVCARVPVL